MRKRVEIPHGRYTEIQYRMFDLSPRERLWMRIAGWVTLPLVYPLVLIVKMSPETGFRTISEMLSLIPFAFGVIVRYEFYRRSLLSCGQNVIVNFGTVFYYPEISIGDNVCIGMFNTIHHCDFGNNVITAEQCAFLGGRYYHGFSRVDVPMIHQDGRMKRIRVGSDVWVGAHCVIMEDIEDGAVVGAGSVVINKVEPYTIVAGNPARLIRKRDR